MAHWLLQQEGLFVGSSSAMNVVAACRVAKRLPVDSVIVTGTSTRQQRWISWTPSTPVGHTPLLYLSFTVTP